MIIKKKNSKQIPGEEQNLSLQSGGGQSISEQDIDLFDLDNIDFKQRQERRRGDRRRGFRRIDDRNLISRAREEAVAIKEAASKEGYQDGLNQFRSDIEYVKDSVKSFFDAPQQVYDYIAGDILDISIDIAKKIIKKEITENPEIILDNIKDIMKGLSKEESKITLRVNPAQTAFLKQELPETAKSLGLEVKIYVVDDDSVMEGGCVMTTTNGVIDFTIESQLAIISEVLKEI